MKIIAIRHTSYPSIELIGGDKREIKHQRKVTSNMGTMIASMIS